MLAGWGIDWGKDTAIHAKDLKIMKTIPSEQSLEPLILDVRPVFASGGSPCTLIDEAVGRLKPGQAFVLLVPFEPRPLYAKLGREGFTHHPEETEDGTWRIEFRRGKQVGATVAHESCECGGKSGGATGEIKGDISIDTCGLEPPEPLVRALEKVGQLQKGRKLTVRSDRKPVHLFTELENRGFTYDCNEQPDHNFITEIRHA